MLQFKYGTRKLPLEPIFIELRHVGEVMQWGQATRQQACHTVESRANVFVGSKATRRSSP